MARYQVWFTVLGATIISAASVWIGYLQWGTADIQERIAEAQALPVFEIQIVQIKDEATGVYKTNELQVNVVEGRAFHFIGVAAYFLDFEGVTKGPPSKTVDFSLPVRGYYFSAEVSPATKGRLFAVRRDNNNSMYIALAQALRQESPKYSFVNSDERTYLRCTYDDLLGRRHLDFYQVFSVGGSFQMSASDGNKIFSQWNADKARTALDQITPEFVYTNLDAVAPK